ncbi:MAG: hypothetical protein ACI8T1_004240 [Verrucomicrobiales bacterium]|jgi:hypothetical protein
MAAILAQVFNDQVDVLPSRHGGLRVPKAEALRKMLLHESARLFQHGLGNGSTGQLSRSLPCGGIDYVRSVHSLLYGVFAAVSSRPAVHP